jgi:hypothetical protein
MITSLAVSFAPGSAGHFVGAMCQHLINGDKLIVSPDGSCHENRVKFWGATELILETSSEGLVHEIVTLKRKLQPSESVTVTHARNLHTLSEIFDKVIYISFTETDVSEIVKKYRKKNQNSLISEANYLNIRAESWPLYQDYVLGQAPAYIYDEINMMSKSSMYNNWVWVIPALTKSKSIHEIQFSDIWSDDSSWLLNLCEFLSVDITTYAVEKWQEYQSVNRAQ